MYNLTEQQKELCAKEVIMFNRLITTEEQRSTKEYITLCDNLLKEEFNEMLDASTKEDQVQYLDGVCDTFVTLVQLQDALGKDSFTSELLEDYVVVPHVSGYYCWPTPAKRRRDYYGAILEVCRSNLTKVPTIREVIGMYGPDLAIACEAAKDWVETHRSYKGIWWDTVVDADWTWRVVFKDENNKVMKPWCFEEPQLEQFISSY